MFAYATEALDGIHSAARFPYSNIVPTPTRNRIGFQASSFFGGTPCVARAIGAQKSSAEISQTHPELDREMVHLAGRWKSQFGQQTGPQASGHQRCCTSFTSASAEYLVPASADSAKE
jgi:hypothetical protein